MVKGILVAIVGLALHLALGGLNRLAPGLASAAWQAAVPQRAAQDTEEPPEPPGEEGWAAAVLAGPCPRLDLLPDSRLSVCMRWDMAGLRAAAAEALGLTDDELVEQLFKHGTLGEVADALGVDREAVAGAIQAEALAQLEAELNAAVEAGALSRETAELWLERWRGQDFSYLLDSPFFFRFGWPRPPFEDFPFEDFRLLPRLRGDGLPPLNFSFRFEVREDGRPLTIEVSSESEAFQRALAEALGISVEKLRDELEAGRSLHDLAGRYGLTDEEMNDAFRAAIRAAVREQLDEAVAEGRLTQAQADRILEDLEDGPVISIRRWPGLPELPGEWRRFFWFPGGEPLGPLD